MNHHESSWIIINHHESSWIIMNHHKSSWIIMNHHESSWIIMNHHESSWIGFSQLAHESSSPFLIHFVLLQPLFAIPSLQFRIIMALKTSKSASSNTLPLTFCRTIVLDDLVTRCKSRYIRKNWSDIARILTLREALMVLSVNPCFLDCLHLHCFLFFTTLMQSQIGLFSQFSLFGDAIVVSGVHPRQNYVFGWSAWRRDLGQFL